MTTWLIPGVLGFSYLLGSLPSGYILVKLRNGKDIRKIESGRMGGTNVMRAAGFWAGLGTALLDILKSASTVMLAKALLPDLPWLHVLAPLAAILGHNYSVFMLQRDQAGRLKFRGGAGGAPTVGGALGLWFPSLLFVVPIGALVLYFIGYASVATLSVALVATLVFIYRAWIGVSPWEYVGYGLLAQLLLVWSLRPNIQRLINGSERLVGFRARYRSVKAKERVTSKS
jgi:acyl phosphate:glycerol-3-phosphate acyltransferase